MEASPVLTTRVLQKTRLFVCEVFKSIVILSDVNDLKREQYPALPCPAQMICSFCGLCVVYWSLPVRGLMLCPHNRVHYASQAL